MWGEAGHRGVVQLWLEVYQSHRHLEGEGRSWSWSERLKEDGRGTIMLFAHEKNVPQPKSFQNQCTYLVLCAISRDGCSSWDGKSGVI